VIVADTGAIVSEDDAWTYLEPAVITSVNPAYGQFGTFVTISGARLEGSGSGSGADIVDTVALAGVGAEVISSTNTTVVVRAADSAPGTGDVLITTLTGIRHTLSSAWEYRELGVVVTAEPNVGVSGTTVILYGVNLQGHGGAVVRVQLAGVDASIEREADQFVTVTAGSGVAGTTGDVVVTADSGAVITSSNAFSYVAVGIITAANPPSGVGNTIVTISGAGMLSGSTGVSSITLAGVAATVQSVTDSEIVVQAGPEGVDGTLGDVVIITNTGVRSVLADGFQYLEAGTIYDVSPAIGHFGTRVVITGITLLGGGDLVSVTLAGLQATVAASSETRIELIAAASSVAQTGKVVITNNEGVAVERLVGWEYTPQATVTRITPSSGQIGTLVTIEGSGFLMGESGGFTSVALTTVDARIDSFSDTRIVLEAAGGSDLSVADVQITALDGGYVRGGVWQYVVAGDITSVSPAGGQG